MSTAPMLFQFYRAVASMQADLPGQVENVL